MEHASILLSQLLDAEYRHSKVLFIRQASAKSTLEFPERFLGEMQSFVFDSKLFDNNSSLPPPSHPTVLVKVSNTQFFSFYCVSINLDTIPYSGTMIFI